MWLVSRTFTGIQVSHLTRVLQFSVPPQKLACVCNKTTTPSTVHWLARNGKVLPKLKKVVYYRLDHTLKRKRPGTAVQHRIKN